MEEIQWRKKYALVAWPTICKSKSQGGLYILDLELIDQNLLAKWLVRCLDPKVEGLWKIMLHAKYTYIPVLGMLYLLFGNDCN
jgi:hypothetical protein